MSAPFLKYKTAVVIFWNFLNILSIFSPTKMKQNVIVRDENGTYDLPHELPNDLRFRILRD